MIPFLQNIDNYKQKKYTLINRCYLVLFQPLGRHPSTEKALEGHTKGEHGHEHRSDDAWDDDPRSAQGVTFRDRPAEIPASADCSLGGQSALHFS